MDTPLGANLTVRLPKDLRARVKRQAEREMRSQNSLIIIAVREYLDRTMQRCAGADPDPYACPGDHWYEQEDD